jgi:hypothetical protein
LQFTSPTAANWTEFNVSELESADRSFSHLCYELNPDQEALLAVYQQKWKELIFKMGKVDQQQAIEAIRIAYTAIGETLRLLFFAVILNLLSQITSITGMRYSTGKAFTVASIGCSGLTWRMSLRPKSALSYTNT